MTHTWDPDRYLTYADERGRPFVELVARVGAGRPAEVVDLGCGPGNLTGLLAERWPAAHVVGLDSSPEMIEKARGSASPSTTPSPTFATGTRSARSTCWSPTQPCSGCPATSSCSRRWSPRWRQVAGSRSRSRATSTSPATPSAASWPRCRRTQSTRRGVATPSSHDPAVYYDALAALGCTVDTWETTYLHVLSGPDPVFTWVSGTGARPTLQALPDDLRVEFEAEFKARLAAAYPARGDGTVLLRFRRVFAVARVAGVRLHHVQVTCPAGGEDAARRFYAEGLG